MFKVNLTPTFTHPVTVCVPVDGGFREDKCKATFRVLPAEDLGMGDAQISQVESVRRILVNMEELEGDDGQPMAWSDELRDQLIAVPYVRAALIQTYLAAVTKTRVGN
ncbi:MAG: hypothetical protein KGL44_03645 [Sphingomonadales bacterium]|nr:hypothetical protein [Sphingomonadales bacterium]